MLIGNLDSRVRKWGRFLVTLALFLLWSSVAHAQRIPLILVGIAGTGLLAPFVAVPFKIIILRLLSAEATGRRLWFISAIEWVLWFPVAGFTVLSGGPPILLLVLPLLLALSIWLHRERVNNASWGNALLLSLPTPILAVAIPSLAFVSAPLLEDYLPAWLL